MVAPSRPLAGTRRLSLTRRGRVVVFAAALLVTLTALVLAVMPQVVATDTSGDPLHVTQVTVQPGDTLWEIAAAANPGGDVTATVDEIGQLNALEEGQLRVGQELAVPLY